jgi:CRISPR-associated protein Csd2
MSTAMNTPVSNRYDFALLFDVIDGNPNGDPDAGNLPRLDPQTLQGLVTDGCIKRKLRNAINVLGEGRAGTEIYFQTQDAVYEKRVLNLIHQTAWDTLGLKPSEPESKEVSVNDAERKKGGKKKGGKPDKGDIDKVAHARKWMCEHFYDVRAFGAVMTTGVNCGQVRGPVQITFARSIDPILQMDIAITRKSVTSVDRANEQINRKDSDTGKRVGVITGEMGRKNTVPYALYRCHGFVNPYLAKDTGFSKADLEMLWTALKGAMWEIDRSASRGLMATRGLYVFEHSSMLGNAPAHELFERIVVAPLGPDKAPRQFADYKGGLKVNDKDLPAGVTLHRLVG